MNDIMTVLGLATFSTAVGATLCITQYIKPLLPKVNTRLIALLIALVLMMLVTFSSGGNLVAYGIAVINSVLIASSAMGVYELTFSKNDAKRKDKAPEDKTNG